MPRLPVQTPHHPELGAIAGGESVATAVPLAARGQPVAVVRLQCVEPTASSLESLREVRLRPPGPPKNVRQGGPAIGP